MTNEKSLSDKIYDGDNEYIASILVKDVKEFIKLLKYRINHRTTTSNSEIIGVINELAGEQLA